MLHRLRLNLPAIPRSSLYIALYELSNWSVMFYLFLGHIKSRYTTLITGNPHGIGHLSIHPENRPQSILLLPTHFGSLDQFSILYIKGHWHTRYAKTFEVFKISRDIVSFTWNGYRGFWRFVEEAWPNIFNSSKVIGQRYTLEKGMSDIISNLLYNLGIYTRLDNTNQASRQTKLCA